MIVIERTQMSSLIRHYSIVKQFDRHRSVQQQNVFFHSLLQKAFKPIHSSPCLVEMKTEIKQLKRENETLKREIAELRETNSKLKESLDEAVRSNRPRPQLPPRGLKPSHTRSQAGSEAADRMLIAICGNS